MNACRYNDAEQDSSEYCGKPEECKNDDEGCNGSEAQKKLGLGKCEKLDNGQPIGFGQTGCGNNFNGYYGMTTGAKCKSQWPVVDIVLVEDQIILNIKKDLDNARIQNIVIGSLDIVENVNH